MSVQLSLPKALIVTQPLGPPLRASCHRLAVVEHLLEDHVGVEHGGLAEARAYHFAGVPKEAVGIALADLDAGTGLRKLHLLDDVEDQVAQTSFTASAAVRRFTPPTLIKAKSV